MREILGVYAADGGLRGEAAYVVGKLLGRVHCALCDITHSPVRRKAAWDRLVAGSAVPIRVVHRNELSAAEADALAAVQWPVVAGRTDTGWTVLLDAAALDDAAGSVDRFAEMLDAALAEAHR